VVSADGTVVDNNVPGPQRHGIPLFDLEPLKKLVILKKSPTGHEIEKSLHVLANTVMPLNSALYKM